MAKNAVFPSESLAQEQQKLSPGKQMNIAASQAAGVADSSDPNKPKNLKRNVSFADETAGKELTQVYTIPPRERTSCCTVCAARCILPGFWLSGIGSLAAASASHPGLCRSPEKGVSCLLCERCVDQSSKRPTCCSALAAFVHLARKP